MKIVVIGGTGLVGSQVAGLLTDQGHDVVAASPQSGVDTVTGAGVAEALDGAQVVVDLSNSPSFAEEDATRFFTTSTRNLLDAEAAAGVRHHVIVSIVGSDTLDSGYMRAKVAQESLVRASGSGWSVVRSTQFFEFLGHIADDATADGEVRIAPVAFQPIASADVARIVADVATGEPVGDIEIAGPDLFKFDELVSAYLDGDGRQVVPDPSAQYFGATLADGSLVPAGEARLGATSYEKWRAQEG
jgi:uncharacterized protein YbjT (DUF2867 family)